MDVVHDGITTATTAQMFPFTCSEIEFIGPSSTTLFGEQFRGFLVRPVSAKISLLQECHVAIIVIFHLFSVLPLSLCGSAVMVFRILLTTEAQRTPRLHRDKMENYE